MLLAAGKKGKRFSLPHTQIKMAPPRINRSFGSTVDMMIKANELEDTNDTYVRFMSKFTGKTQEQVRSAAVRMLTSCCSRRAPLPHVPPVHILLFNVCQ